jgi:hypothetical protein
VLAVLLLAASVSFSPSRTLVIVDEQGNPASAYVRFHYEGHLLNFVHSVSYVGRGSEIVMTDAEGRIVIPWRFHARPPFPISTPPKLFIDDVYVPRLHNAFGPVTRLTNGRPGVFTVDEAGERVTVSNLEKAPEAWEMSMNQLLRALRETATSRAAVEPGDSRSRQHARELVGHLRAEHAAFLAQHAAVERPRPAAPPGASGPQQDAWQEALDAQWARARTWGAYLQPMWSRTPAELATLEDRLR